MHYGWLRGGTLSMPIFNILQNIGFSNNPNKNPWKTSKNALTIFLGINFGQLNCTKIFPTLLSGCIENNVKYETADTSDGKKYYVQDNFVLLLIIIIFSIFIFSSASGTIGDLLDCYMACRNTDGCDGVRIKNTPMPYGLMGMRMVEMLVFVVREAVQ